MKKRKWLQNINRKNFHQTEFLWEGDFYQTEMDFVAWLLIC